MLAAIGSDIPVCLYSNYALVRGKGEKIVTLPKFGVRIWAVIIKPNFHISTERIFALFKGPFSKSTKKIFDFDDLIEDMNNLQNDLAVVIRNEYKKINNLINSVTTSKCLTSVRITGSGSAIFVTFRKHYLARDYARKIANINNNNLWIKISHIDI